MDDKTKENDGLLNFDHIASENSQTEMKPNESSLERLRKQNAIVEELEKLTMTCKKDEDLIILRKKVIETNYDNLNKRDLLDELDNYVIERIAPIIEEASSLEEMKQDLKNTYIGAVVIVIIGFFLSSHFSSAFFISIILAVMGIIGNFNGKERKASENAVRIIEEFKKAGYPIKY